MRIYTDINKGINQKFGEEQRIYIIQSTFHQHTYYFQRRKKYSEEVTQIPHSGVMSEHYQ